MSMYRLRFSSLPFDGALIVTKGDRVVPNRRRDLFPNDYKGRPHAGMEFVNV